MKNIATFRWLVLAGVALLLLLGPATAAGQDTGDPPAWVAPMKKVRARFTGTPGTFAQFGDSITVSMAFWAPLRGEPKNMPKDMAAAHKLVKDTMNPDCWVKWRGPAFGSNGGMTIRWAHDNADKWLKTHNPEVAVIMFGTNDLFQLEAKEFEKKTTEVVERCLKNGTIVLLTTLPPCNGREEKSKEFAAAVRRVAKELKVPLIDYHTEVLKRRPEDWNGTMAKFKDVKGVYEVPTLISADGVHPSNPKAHQDYSEESLNKNGYLLRNYMTLHAYADVIRQVLPKKAAAAPKFPFDAETARRYQKEFAKSVGLPVEFVNGLGMRFVLVPPGTFRMGSPKDEPGRKDDEAAHEVTLTTPIYLGKHEVTVGQFRRFVTATKYITDGEKNGGGHAHDAKAVWIHRPGTNWLKPGYADPFNLKDEHPVVHVSHTDAVVFCRWMSQVVREKDAPRGPYGLPTEAQWEWACRAGSADRFWWGPDEDKTGRVANVGDKSLKKVHPDWPRTIMPMDDGHAFAAPVGTFPSNAFGLHDMLGNVWEFCSTKAGPYPKGPVTDLGDLDPKRGFAVRGGGWSNVAADARCATRNADPPHFCHSNLGFRVALIPELAAPTASEDWTRFRGPNGSGVSQATMAPVRWTEKDFAWKVKLPGIGHSSPVVWKDRVFITSGDDAAGQRHIFCRRLDDGGEVWTKSFTADKHRQHEHNSWASATPAVDERHVYIAWASQKEYVVLTLDHSGKEKWRKDLGPFQSGHGFGVSPIVLDDRVIVANEQEGKSSLVALDRQTGDVRWTAPRRSKTTYATPCVYTAPGRAAELIFANYEHGLTSVDPKTGNVNWEIDIFDKGHIETTIASPVVAGDFVLGSSGWLGVKKEVIAVRPPAPGEKPQVAYRLHKGMPLVPTPLVTKGFLFSLGDEGVVTCADVKDGSVHWQERVEGNFYSSPICVGDHLYSVTRAGEVVVTRIGKKLLVVARNPLGEGSHSTPAVAGDTLIFRTFRHLIAVGPKK